MRIFKSVVASLLFLSLITGPAAAQKGRTGTDKSQAALTIQVNVAPVILTPKQGAQAQDQAISYSIPVATVRYSVTETIRAEISNGKSERVVVKTVVAE